MSSSKPLGFFEEGSPYLHHPLLTPERTAEEVDFVIEQLDLPPGARFLDVGCGFGRHTIELARRDFRVVGIDPSAAMIAAARQRAALAGVNVTFLQLPAEQYVLTSAFDAAICLFSTLGQVDEAGNNNLALVQKAYGALRSGGLFVVEVPQRQPYLSQLKPVDRFEAGEKITTVERHYDQTERVIDEKFIVVTPARETTYRIRLQLFSQEELSLLLQEAGFRIFSTFANYYGQSLTEDSPMMLFIASV